MVILSLMIFETQIGNNGRMIYLLLRELVTIPVQRHYSNVVLLFPIGACEGDQLTEEEIDERGSSRVFAEELFEVEKAEHFAFWVMGFYEAVAVEEEAFSGGEGCFVFLVAHVGHETEGHAGCS